MDDDDGATTLMYTYLLFNILIRGIVGKETEFTEFTLFVLFYFNTAYRLSVDTTMFLGSYNILYLHGVSYKAKQSGIM